MLITSLILLSLLAILWLYLFLSPAHAWAFRHPVNANTPIASLEGDWPSVAVVVPARNESEWIPTTVPSYCRQDYPNLRVILVDDQSNDGSQAILEQQQKEFPNFTVLHGKPRPQGWCGKPWAVHQGTIEAAGSEWLMLTDADCVFHPQAVKQAMRLARAHKADAVSFFPEMILGSFTEAVGLAGLATVLAMIMPMGKSNDPKWKQIAIIAGGFILVKRSAYDAVGGHEGVKAMMIEDVFLGRRLKAEGFTLHTRLTQDLVSTRMYNGVKDLWEGLAKNAYAGMDYDPKKFVVGFPFGWLFAVLPPVYFVWTLLAAMRSHTAVAWVMFGLAALICTCQVLTHARTTRHMKLPIYHALFMPLSAGLYSVIAGYSVWQHHFGGGNVWAGRQYGREMLLDAMKPVEEKQA